MSKTTAITLYLEKGLGGLSVTNGFDNLLISEDMHREKKKQKKKQKKLPPPTTIQTQRSYKFTEEKIRTSHTHG